MSSTILPPRFEDRDAELEAFPVIPVYEEVSGSLRPTWIPVDPTTFIPPAPKKSRAKTFALLATLAFMTWGVGFASVVGGHAVMQRFDRRAAAAAPISEPAPIAITTATTQAASLARVASAGGSISPSQPASAMGDSGIMFTVDVNDLPVIKNKPRSTKSRSRGRDAGS